MSQRAARIITSTKYIALHCPTQPALALFFFSLLPPQHGGLDVDTPARNSRARCSPSTMLRLTLLSVFFFLLPIAVTIGLTLALESQRIFFGKGAPTRLTTNTYCEKLLGITPYPARYICEQPPILFSHPLPGLPGHRAAPHRAGPPLAYAARSHSANGVGARQGPDFRRQNWPPCSWRGNAKAQPPVVKLSWLTLTAQSIPMYGATLATRVCCV